MSGYSFKCENVFYVLFKKHYCPNCESKLLRKKVSKVVNSESYEAKDYDFDVCDITVKGNMKFTCIEFYCEQCNRYYTVNDVKNNKV